MTNLILFVLLSGTFLSAAENGLTNDGPEGGPNPIKTFFSWLTTSGTCEEGSSQYFANEKPKEPSTLLPTQPIEEALRRAQQGNAHPWMLHTSDARQTRPEILRSGHTIPFEKKTPPPNETTDAPKANNASPKQPDAPEPWKTYTFEGTQLSLTTWSPYDPTYTNFYGEAFNGLLSAILNPTGVNRVLATKTPALEQLIQTMETTLNECSNGNSINFLAQTEVTSLQESRAISSSLLARYKAMQHDFITHFDATLNISSLLHKSIQHDERIREESQSRIQKNTPTELLANIKANIDSSNRNIALHQNMLTDILCLFRAMYPAETSGWECVDIDEDLPTQPAVTVADGAQAQPTLPVSLKTVLGVDSLPLERTLMIPEADTHERSYQEFLRQILGTECWALNHAQSSGRLKWMSSPIVVRTAFTDESATTPRGGMFVTPGEPIAPTAETAALATQPES